jgi:hypothetical protein
MTSVEILFLILTGLQPGDRNTKNVKNGFNGLSRSASGRGSFVYFIVVAGKQKLLKRFAAI